MIHKYTKDGRKVVVVGNLNNEETIVQEIFITGNGDEIPGGERFVERSLFDQPVKSYKEKSVDKAEERLETLEKNYQQTQKLSRDAKSRLDALYSVLRSAESVEKKILCDDGALKDLLLVLAGAVNWLVVKRWQSIVLVDFIDGIKKRDEYGRESIKLLSLFGDSKGNLEYKLHEYSDGSGNSSMVVPFAEKGDALEFIKAESLKLSEGGDLSLDQFKYCIGLGIEFDSGVKEKIVSTCRARFEKTLADNRANFEREQEKIVGAMEGLEAL